MRSTNCQFRIDERRDPRAWGDFGRRDTGAALEPLRRDCDATRNGIHAREMLRLIRDIERLERLTALRALSQVPTAGAPYRRARKMVT